MNESTHHNPETEWYHQQIVKDRHSLRKSGIIAFIIGVCLLPAGIFLLTSSLPQVLRDASVFQPIVLFATTLGTPLGFILLGLLQYRDSKRPVVQEEVLQKRQQERTQLFRMAQGKIPWRYSKAVFIIFTIFGLLFLIPGIATLVYTTGYSDGGLVWGILYSLMGLLLLIYGVIILPRRIQRLPAESVQALAASFVAGEVTQGVQAQDHPER